MSENKIESNYDSIKKMSLEEIAILLDYVYVTGLNNGMYAVGLEDDKQDEVLGNCPYDDKWLDSEAEKAIRELSSEEYCLDSLAKSVLNLAGINSDEMDIEDEK